MIQMNNQYCAFEINRNTQNSYYNIDIRNLINTGKIQNAEQILNSIPVEGRDAEWYFLNGIIMSNKGWLNDAYNSFQTACKMAPLNGEYTTAYNRMIIFSRDTDDNYDRDENMVLCADCCCNCCCDKICD